MQFRSAKEKINPVEFEGPVPWRRIAVYLKPALIPVRTTIIFMVVVTTISSLIALIPPYIGKQLFDKGISTGNNENIIKYGLFSILLILIAATLRYLSKISYAKVNNRFSLGLQNRLLTRLVNLPLDFFDNKQSGYLAGRVNEADAVAGLFSPTLFQFISSIFQGIIAIVISMNISSKVTLIMLPFLLLLAIIIVWINGVLRRTTYDLMETSASTQGALQEIIFGINDIKNYDIQNRKLSDTLRQYKNVAEKRIKQTMYLSAGTESLTFITSAFSVILMMMIGTYIAKGQLTLGDYIALSGYSIMILTPAQMLGGVVAIFQPILISLRRLLFFFESKTESEICGNRKVVKINGEINFKEVTFGYEDNKPVLNKCNLTICQGECVAILGKNGSGKSTILKLTLGLYQKYSGVILIDQIDIRDLNTMSLREKIGIVSQNVFLFHGSLLDNLKLASPNASIEAIERAVTLSGCKTLFDDYNHVQIEEFGSNLSGGQRQAASVARCILKDPDLLMFDEATAHLDNETRRVVLSAIKSVFKERTRIIITHDKEVASIADRVYLLEEGGIKELNHMEEGWVEEDNIIRY